MIAENIMTTHPIYVNADLSIREVVNKLLDNDFRHLPVLSDGELVGMISDRDLQRFTYSLFVEELEDRHLETDLDRPISEIMRTGIVTVNPETDLVEVIDIMIAEKIGAVPVILPGKGKLVGIISYVDIISTAKDYLGES